MEISIVKPSDSFPPKWDLADILPKGLDIMLEIKNAPIFVPLIEVPVEEKPEIFIQGGNLPEIIKQAEKALMKSGSSIYQYGTVLVRLVTPNEPNRELSDSFVSRAKNSTLLMPVKKYWLIEQLAKSAKWYKSSGENKTECDPDPKIAMHIIERSGDWSFFTLSGIVNSPTIMLDGTILNKEGYDEKTGLLLNFNGIHFSEVKVMPTRDDALESLKNLKKPFKDFPYADDASKSVPIAAVMTGIMRKGINAAPMFCVDAPVAGTGKSMLCEVVGILCDGYKPSAMNQGATTEEDEKRVGACLLSGDNTVLIDNCTRPIEGDLYCSMLTQSFVQVRPLGKSERVQLPTKTLFLVTGNNLVISGDMNRRVIICRLDPKMENPEERQFDSDPRNIAREKRAEYVIDVITMISAYIGAGKPCPLPKIGSFEDWNIIRETLVWLGCTDPADTRQFLLENDPTKGELMEFLSYWYSVYGGQARSLNQVRQECEHIASGNPKYDLYQFLLSISRSKILSNKSVGRFLTRHKDRIVAGVVLRKKSSSDAVYWNIDIIDQKAWDSVHEKAPESYDVF